MKIIGLNIGHNATACFLNDGQIKDCVQEERFSRIKNHCGIPFKSIKYILDKNGILISDIDLIVLDDHYQVHGVKDIGKKLLEDYTHKPLYRKISSYLGYNFPNAFRKYREFKNIGQKRKAFLTAEKIRVELSKELRFQKEKIIIIDHHLAHAYSVCFNLPKNRKTLVFTLDGEGTRSSATVNIFDGKNIKVISRTHKSASLGYLYGIATIFLGMKPLQHEFKVMGLAPYAKQHSIDQVYSKFKSLIWLKKDLSFDSKFEMVFSDHFFKKEMAFVRFDVVAGAVQRLVEDLTQNWVKSSIKFTGIHDIALSGGVFMNVKANQKLSDMPEVKSIFPMPSSGDESNAIGSCFYGYKIFCDKNGVEFNPKPITHLYLGPEYSQDYVSSWIKLKKISERYKITKPKNINKEIAKLLSKGEIVSRCSGKSEWGARALGNRSILANPVHSDTVRILNETIKDRDFWMPFTPSMLDSSAKDYFKNTKNIPTEYMIITFDSTSKAQKELPAAMHPYDFTIRPQVVYKDWNSDYHEILSEFKRLTGTGALLNTSFNLHGEPNVLTPEDAVHTVDNSSLKYLAIGDYLLEKKK